MSLADEQFRAANDAYCKIRQYEADNYTFVTFETHERALRAALTAALARRAAPERIAIEAAHEATLSYLKGNPRASATIGKARHDDVTGLIRAILSTLQPAQAEDGHDKP